MTKEKVRASFHLDKELIKEFKKKCMDFDVRPIVMLHNLIRNWLEEGSKSKKK